MLQAMDRGSKEADDKEQLSPVAVMDFPFDDDYEDDAVEEEGRVGGTGACSTSFSDSLAQLHQSKICKCPTKSGFCKYGIRSTVLLSFAPTRYGRSRKAALRG